MKRMIPVIFLFLLALTACGNHSHESHDQHNENLVKGSLEPLNVTILTPVDAFQPKKEGVLKIKVTKGDEAVANATKVRFEIFKKGHKQESKKFEAINKGNGIYALKHTFPQKGRYVVIAHVTARGSHTMPQKTLIVGDVKELKTSK